MILDTYCICVLCLNSFLSLILRRNMSHIDYVNVSTLSYVFKLRDLNFKLHETSCQKYKVFYTFVRQLVCQSSFFFFSAALFKPLQKTQSGIMNKMCNVHTNRFPISLFFCEVWSFWSQNFIYSLNKVTVCRDNSLLHLLLCFARINFARIQNSVMCIGLGNFDSCISWKFWPVWTLLKIVINSMSAKLFVNQWTKLQESWCILRTHL